MVLVYRYTFKRPRNKMIVCEKPQDKTDVSKQKHIPYSSFIVLSFPRGHSPQCRWQWQGSTGQWANKEGAGNYLFIRAESIEKGES